MQKFGLIAASRKAGGPLGKIFSHSWRGTEAMTAAGLSGTRGIHTIEAG